MTLTAMTKTKTQSTGKKPTDDKKVSSTKPVPKETGSTKRKKDEGEPARKVKKGPQSASTATKQQPKLISVNANAKPKSSSKFAPFTKPAKTKQQAKAKEKLSSPAASISDGEDNEEEQAEGEEEEGASGNDHLHGFSTDEDDSSDEDEEAGEDKPGLSAFEISKLPTVAKDDESVKRRLEKAKRQPTEDRGVVYIGRLPHGFYEEQLKGYFSQFGNITRLRISRNKKTGKCKHYGFIEFGSSSVAQIVAETMDDYLLSGHILKCKVIPKDEVHPELWIGANRKWRVVPRDRIVRVQHNKSRTEEEQVKSNKRLIKRQNERKRKLEALGIDYDFDAAGYKKAKADTKA
ncbi:hypothetical protein P691DRAFT_707995 [Macrolepiota fuliginosa MF-IS2]|uniref:RRM domain-containing protein n=1 Tax=Macrolepiota fuliginosa MF-IS2 TaxID=1400762 RepID=A0A9P6C2R9_9AGAR|nr:hypothetical protein P691DRAFT_707995 [Macrolepiota fuliginosa MF-IS2]